MLRIRPEQMVALDAACLAAFIDDAVVHVERLVATGRLTLPSDESLRAWVERRVARGRALGLVEEDSTLRHLEVAGRFGEAFADGPDVIHFVDDEELCEVWPVALRQLESQARAVATMEEGE